MTNIMNVDMNGYGVGHNSWNTANLFPQSLAAFQTIELHIFFTAHNLLTEYCFDKNKLNCCGCFLDAFPSVHLMD